LVRDESARARILYNTFDGCEIYVAVICGIVRWDQKEIIVCPL